MSAQRKTIEVVKVLEWTNNYLATKSQYISAENRAGAAGLLEQVLHATGNYAGFSYLPGYPEQSKGVPIDETRRQYHIKGGLL